MLLEKHLESYEQVETGVSYLSHIQRRHSQLQELGFLVNAPAEMKGLT